MTYPSQITEGSSEPLVINFKNEDGDPIVPATLYWQIDDIVSGQSVLASTEIGSPASTQTFQILPAYTQIINENNLRELREVTVLATFSGGKAQNISIQYEVINLRFI